MPFMRAAEIRTPGGPFELVERDLPEPGPGHVRIAVEAAGVCHTDIQFVNLTLPGLVTPVVPGHEVAGRIDAAGEGVSAEDWPVGKRVGVGWFGGSCGHCAACRAGEFIHCTRLKIPGVAYPGGFATHMVAPVDALAAVPDGLTATEAAPLGCAGVTTFQALRRSGARAGDLVAIIGIGGLGHLAVQYAVRSGFRTVAIARGEDKRKLAETLGAHHYIDSTAEDPAEALLRLGGAQVVLGTAHSSAAMEAGINGLAADGNLVLAGFTGEALHVRPTDMAPLTRRVSGHPSGTAFDIEQTMAFSAFAGVRPMVETFPLAEVGEAVRRMESGAARFRVVLEP